MQTYELGYLILPSIPEDGLSLVVEKMKGLVAKAGGKVFDGEDPFKQELSYSMSKVVGASKYVTNEAYIGWMKFELEASIVPKVKTGLDKIEELLRFLLIKAPHDSTFTFAKARAAILEKMAKDSEEARFSSENENSHTIVETVVVE